MPFAHGAGSMSSQSKSSLANALSRDALISRQLGALSDSHSARKHLQRAIETATSIRFARRDQAALRLFLKNAIARLRAGDIDEGTARAAINRLAMAAASNSPDVLHLIHAGA